VTILAQNKISQKYEKTEHTNGDGVQKASLRNESAYKPLLHGSNKNDTNGVCSRTV
jgi:hypothetical protein